MDNDKTGGGLGLPVLIALAGGLLERSTRGGLIIVGSLNLGGSLEMLPNAVALVEIAIEKQAAVLLMPVAARRQHRVLQRTERRLFQGAGGVIMSKKVGRNDPCPWP